MLRTKKFISILLSVLLILGSIFLNLPSTSNAGSKTSMLRGIENGTATIDGVAFNITKEYTTSNGNKIGDGITIWAPVNTSTTYNKITFPYAVSLDNTTYPIKYFDSGLQGVRNVKEMDLSACTNLYQFQYYGRGETQKGILEKVTFPNTDKLRSINLSCNNFTSIPIFPSNIKANLNDINMQYNGISGIADFSNYPKLTNLQLSNNNISQLNTNASEKIKKIEIDHNNLESFTHTTNETCNIYLDNNHIGRNQGTINLSNMPNLMILEAQNNEISSINLSANTSIETLLLNDNNLTSIDLSAQYSGGSFSKLTSLVTKNNPILYSNFTPSRAILVAKFGESNIGGYQVAPTTYKITYNANGGNGTMSESTVIEGNSYTLPPCSFTMNGYTFKKWGINSQGTGTTYADQYTFSSYNAGNLTLYAIWEQNPVPAETFTVTYNANGGLGTMSNSTATKNQSFTLKKNTFTRNGYTFKKWGINAGGTGTTYTDQYTFSSYNAGNLNLFAIWEQNTSPTPTPTPTPDPPSVDPPNKPVVKILKLVTMSKLTIKAKKGKVVVKIKRPKDYKKISGYVFSYRFKIGNKFTKFKNYKIAKNKTSITILGLAKNAKVQIKIRSFGYYTNAKGKKVKVYSKYSKTSLSGKVK